MMKIKDAENAYTMRTNVYLLRSLSFILEEISTHRMSTRRNFKRVDRCYHQDMPSQTDIFTESRIYCTDTQTGV